MPWCHVKSKRRQKDQVTGNVDLPFRHWAPSMKLSHNFLHEYQQSIRDVVKGGEYDQTRMHIYRQLSSTDSKVKEQRVIISVLMGLTLSDGTEYAGWWWKARAQIYPRPSMLHSFTVLPAHSWTPLCLCSRSFCFWVSMSSGNSNL